MIKPKELIGLDHDNYDCPLVDASHLSYPMGARRTTGEDNGTVVLHKVKQLI